MIPAIKSDLRKLFTVRSTYIVSFLAIAFVVLFSWVMVWEMKNNVSVPQGEQTASPAEERQVGTGGEPETSETPPEDAQSLTEGSDAESAASEIQEYRATRLREVILNAIPTAGLFVILIIILQIVHEYRYNTIMHSMTLSNSRTKVLASKLIALLSFALFIGFIAAIVGVAAFKISVAAYGLDLPPQEFALGEVALRAAAFMLAYSSFAAIIAFFSRNIALAIAVFLIVPSTVESLLGIWLKHNTVYMPFSAMSQILIYGQSGSGSLGLVEALTTTAIYLAILYPLVWFLFLRRDAN